MNKDEIITELQECHKISIKEDYDLMTKQADEYGKALADGLANYLDIEGVVEKVEVEKVVVKESAPKLTVDGIFGKSTILATQKLLGTYQDGYVSSQLKTLSQFAISVDTKYWQFQRVTFTGSQMIKALQKKIDAVADGQFGMNSIKALQRFLNKKGYKLSVDGYMGKLTVKAWQKYLNK